jgi:trimeric autotransporter adhesin
MKIHASILCASLFMALAASAGCGSTSDVTNDGKAVSALTVGPSTDTLTTGSTKQFSATLEYADGTSLDVTSNRDTIWNTSDASVATVSSAGLVTAVKVGPVEITAEFDTVKGDQQFVVTP